MFTGTVNYSVSCFKSYGESGQASESDFTLYLPTLCSESSVVRTNTVSRNFSSRSNT